MRGQTSLVPHEQPIIRPKASETLDYEAELIVVIGKRAKHLTMANATACIAGTRLSAKALARANSASGVFRW